MSMCWTLECFSRGDNSNNKKRMKKKKKKRPLQTMELKVRMDCQGCELKVKKALSSIKGLKSLEINRKQQKVTVTGNVEPGQVLDKVRSTGKADIWTYVPYYHHYTLPPQPPTAAQAHSDSKAPPGGSVRYVPEHPTGAEYSQRSSTTTTNQEGHHISDMFSDDNPNACTVM